MKYEFILDDRESMLTVHADTFELAVKKALELVNVPNGEESHQESNREILDKPGTFSSKDSED